MEETPLEITPTPSMLQGFGGVWQCNNCGLLAAVPGGGKAHTRERLAGCPSCDLGHGWSRQPFDVGPFRKFKQDT